MQEQWDLIRQLAAAGEPFAVARVISTFGSSPRPAGAAMVVRADGSVSGSLSGGCVEGTIYEIAQDSMQEGKPSLHRFGVADADAFAVGLTCGGTIEVFVQPHASFGSHGFDHLWEAVETQHPAALVTILRHPNKVLVGRHLVVGEEAVHGDAEDDVLRAAVARDARGALASGVNCTLQYGTDGRRIGDDIEVFVECFTNRPRMVLFGAIDFSAAVAHTASDLGYHVTVCDARPIFATRQRFPEADEVVVMWPDRYVQQEAEAGRLGPRAVVCVLTHDPKFDVPLLKSLLNLPDAQRPRFIGAMGSRRTHEHRHASLLAAGVEESKLRRLRSPIGLDLGARTPAETAISILAEIIASKWGGTGAPLSGGNRPIHSVPEHQGWLQPHHDLSAALSLAEKSNRS